MHRRTPLPALRPLLTPAFIAALAAPAYGHKPLLIGDGDHNTPATALRIEDIAVSQVAYYDLSDPARPLWLTFNARAGQPLFLQIGVPQIDRLASFRPAVALIGPGLPEAQLPFDLPAGLGAAIFDTAGVGEPRAFHEPFTGTDSWILLEQTTTLPTDGQYYLVAYGPAGQTGKLWVAVGEREEFGFADIAGLGPTIAEVRAFHEVSASGPPCFLFPAVLALAGVLVWRMAGGRRSIRPR